MHGSPSVLASAWPTAAGRSSTNAGVTASVFEKLRVRTGSVAVRVVSPYGRSTFMTSGSCETDRGSRTPVDPAVLVPGEHDLLDVEARLVERDLLDERLDVVAAPRVQPLAHQPREEAGAELDVEAGILEVAAGRHQPGGRGHELHQSARPRSRGRPRVVARLLAHDRGDQIRIDA